MSDKNKPVGRNKRRWARKTATRMLKKKPDSRTMHPADKIMFLAKIKKLEADIKKFGITPTPPRAQPAPIVDEPLPSSQQIADPALWYGPDGARTVSELTFPGE